MKELYECPICGGKMSATSRIVECTFCGKKEWTDYLCSRSHYICEECRISTPDEIIKKTCKHTREKDPTKIAELLMKHPAMPMHGPEHHSLVSAALLASMRNNGLFNIDDAMIDNAIARAKRVPLGSCGAWGACGAAIGVGIAFSVALDIDMMSGEKRSMVLRLVSKILEEISRLNGPRCCKASVMIALGVARTFLADKYGVVFDDEKVKCTFRDRNLQECLKEACSFYSDRRG